ncbi:MAG: hypothetical protein ABUL62_28465 [Myxococcales bacterium]
MAKSHLLVLGLILTGSSVFAACSSDITINGSGGAGEAGASDAGAGNTAGGTSVGQGGEAGSATPSEGGEGGEGGAPVIVPTGPLDPQTVVVPAVSTAKLNHLLVGGTDFMKTEVVSVALADGAVAKGNTYDDGDVIAVSSAGVGFVLERTNDKLHIIENGKSTTEVDLSAPGTATAAIDNKAYVPFLNTSAIAIVDLGDGTVSRRIDLSAYDVAGDGDGSVDVSAGIYDPTAEIAYFVLGRIDRKTIVAPDYRLACSKSPGLIVGIDVKTDAIVDLNGALPGKAVELQLANQTSLSINADGSALYVLNAGCYSANKLTGQGLEVVDTTDGTTTVAYAPTGTDFLSSLILTKGSEALLESFDSTGTKHWNTLDIAAGKLVGAELKGVPDAVTYDGTSLLGVSVAGNVGAVVRYAIATGTSTQISETSWAGEYSSASSTALVE